VTYGEHTQKRMRISMQANDAVMHVFASVSSNAFSNTFRNAVGK